MTNPHVLVVGAATIDTKGRGLSSFAPGSSIPGQIRVSVGGVARNIAENLARLGVDTTLLSAVGDDSSGKRILQRTAEGGVDIEHVMVKPQSRSGAYVVIMDASGAPFVSVDDLEIIQAITPRYIYARRGLVRQADMLVLDANLSAPTIDSLVGLARKYGIPVCADPVSTILAPRLKDYLDDLHLVTPNSTEAQALTGLPATERNDAELAAKTLVKQGVKIALVTMAELGVCYATSASSGNIPAIKTDVVDFTGGGDAMAAAIIFGLLNDLPVDECVRLGVSAAALTLRCRDTVCPDISLDRIYDQLVI
jgi:pseudouridine kinase